MSKSKIDFSKLKEPTNTYLIDLPKEKDISRINLEKKEKKEKFNKLQEPKKMGRPVRGDAPLNKKISISLTAKEEGDIIEKAGNVPVSTYLRDILKKSGVIK